ncbi:B2 bradykinin receptor [Erinaceus europaeus]|uniref:B2 bradykinin receptor n=1 Tax=Erinaceus europaeus TaxID=9365 RepID=A0A1S3A4D6_ERIEU|nr:B2 bradykinin receptor [Erinaceus europaeus]
MISTWRIPMFLTVHEDGVSTTASPGADMLNLTAQALQQAVNSSLPQAGARCPHMEWWGWLNTVQAPFLWILFVLAALENTLVLGVFLLHKSSCTVAEIYLGNLAAADLVLVCGLPFWAITIANNFDWIFGATLCRMVNAVVSMNLYSSICFLTLVSADRYLALAKTMTAGRLRGVRCAKFYSLVVWGCALLLSSPMLAFRTLTGYSDEGHNITACVIHYPSPAWEVATNVLLNSVGFLLPLGVTSFCTAGILRALRTNEMQRFKETQTERRATLLVLGVLLLFVACWLPFQISTFLDTLLRLQLLQGCGAEGVVDAFTQVASYLGYSNSCLNPLLYVIVGKRFRRKSREVFQGLCGRRARPGPPENSLGTMRTSISVEHHGHRLPEWPRPTAAGNEG